MRSGAATWPMSYFLKTREILRAEGLDRTPVVADIHSSADRSVRLAQRRSAVCWTAVASRCVGVPEGERIARGETIMQIAGPYDEFGIHETAILGILSSSTGWATAAAEVVAAAGGKPVACFLASRHLHPAVAPRDGTGGGDRRVAPAPATSWVLAWLEATRWGTIPHALALIVGRYAGNRKILPEARTRQRPAGLPGGYVPPKNRKSRRELPESWE